MMLNIDLNEIPKYIESLSSQSIENFNPINLNIPNIEDIFLLLDKHRYNRVLIIDDKDMDGTFGAFICKTYLEALGFDINIFMNKQHGVDSKVLTESNAEQYDLVIIIDSSTNLAHLYKGKRFDTLIIDHHSPNESPDVMDNTEVTTDGFHNFVINVNNKFSGYEHIVNLSAGFLSYLIFHKYYVAKSEHQDSQQSSQSKLDLLRLGIATLYSDIVQTDETIRKIIYYNYQTSKRFNSKNEVNFSIAPKINACRRLNDEITCFALYNNNSTFDQMLNDTFKKSKKIIKLIHNLSKKTEYNGFTLIDLTLANSLLDKPVTNFKGLICNMVISETNKPAVAYLINDNNLLEVSVRSTGLNSLDFINMHREEFEIKGGGHQSAFGFTMPVQYLNEFVDRFDTYIQSQEQINNDYQPINSINDLLDYDTNSIAIYNEINISQDCGFKLNIQSSSFRRIDTATIMVNGIKLKSYKKEIDNTLDTCGNCLIKIIPYISSINNNKFVEFRAELLYHS